MEFSHIDEKLNPTMIDVGHKANTQRSATARCIVDMPEEVMKALEGIDLQSKKGPVVQTAVLAGIMGAKKTPELIPLCHPLAIEKCKVEVKRDGGNSLEIWCTVTIHGKTGVEMEALTGASIAALTVYDMCKGLSHDITIRNLQLMSKAGGKRAFERSS